mgnify:CR=1 FL=1
MPGPTLPDASAKTVLHRAGLRHLSSARERELGRNVEHVRRAVRIALGKKDQDIGRLAAELPSRQHHRLQDDAGIAAFHNHVEVVALTREKDLVLRWKGVPFCRLIDQRNEALNTGFSQIDNVRVGNLPVMLSRDFLPEIVVRRQLRELAQHEAADAGPGPFEIGIVDFELEAAIRAGNQHLLDTAPAQVKAFVKPDVFEVAVRQHRDGQVLVNGFSAGCFDQLTPQNLGVIEDVLFEVQVLIGDEDHEARIISLRFHRYSPCLV